MNIPFDSYEVVIGFECHVQLSTASKLFSSGENRYGCPPNTLLDVVDAGLPGVLPVLNQKVLEYAIRLGVALSCEIKPESVFARKHYFYPDLPKGYQISQFDKPICENGVLWFRVDGIERSIRIRRIHMEEDAGKNIHADGINASFVDYNRAGTPLLEVVSEPDLRSPQEAMEAIRTLRQLVTFLDICDGNMQEGSLRADINVSVRKRGDDKLGTRTETKNLNSFRFLGQAIAFESRRQIIEIESGNTVVQETRLWDPNARESRSLRTKEEAHDYRYFPDPDLLPLRISQRIIEDVRVALPELPREKFTRYRQELGLSEFDANMLISNRPLARYFEEALSTHDNPKGIANWIINDVLRSNKEANSEEGPTEFYTPIPPSSIANLVKNIDEKIISSSIAKRVFAILENSPDKSPNDIIEENGWMVVNDRDEILGMVRKIVDENPDEVEKYRAGKNKVFGFLMGQLMKLGKGKLDPQLADQLLRERLEQK